MSAAEVAQALAAGGRPRTVSIVVPEGWRAADVVRRLIANGIGTQGEVEDLITNPGDLAPTYLPEDANLEGYLFPATYDVPVRSSAEQVVRTMLQRFQDELTARVVTFGLELNAEKTRLLRFGKLATRQRRQRGENKPETFDFLGFTHICGKSRAGRFVLFRHTSKKRMRHRLREVREDLMRHRHLPIPEQGLWIRQVVSGYFAYHAVPTNAGNLTMFRSEIVRAWLHALRRRSQRSRVTWSRMKVYSDRWIPRARILHPWPDERFDARTQGRSRVR